MTTTINAATSTGLSVSSDGSGVLKVQSNGVTTNALAWVNFNGQTTITVRASFNVSSVVRNSAGLYTINFTTAMSDANYCITGTAALLASSTNAYPICPQSYSTTNCQIDHREAGTQADTNIMNVVIFGN